MTDNPLMRIPPGGGGSGVERLHEHVEKLNDYLWVAASGLPYFVNRRLNAKNVFEHYVDRKIGRQE
jgi:hypothetical protein